MRSTGAFKHNKLGPQFAGVLSSLFGYTQADDLPNGTTLLTAYFNEAVNYPDNFIDPSTGVVWDSAADFMAGLDAQLQYDYVSMVGETLRNAQAAMSMTSATNALIALADSTQGLATSTQIITTVGGVGTGSVNLTMAIPTVAAQTTVQVAETAGQAVEAVGTGALTALSWLQYWPYIAAGVGVLVLYFFFSAEGKETGKVSGAIKGIL